jgi:hypothetical protein
VVGTRQGEGSRSYDECGYMIYLLLGKCFDKFIFDIKQNNTQ